MFFRKTFLIIFLASIGGLLPVMANAQDSFTHSMNFESSKLPYNWHTTAWTPCVGVCNDGQQSREVDCKDNAGNLAPSGAAGTECNHTPKPEGIRDCNLPDCQWVAEACPTHEHYTGGGGCGGGGGTTASSSGGQDCGDDKVTDPDTGEEVNQDQL